VKDAQPTRSDKTVTPPPPEFTGEPPGGLEDEDDLPMSHGSGSEFMKLKTQREKVALELAELDLAKKRGEQVELAKVNTLFFNISSTVCESLLNIPDRISPMLAAETDPKKIGDMLNHEIRVALKLISDGKFDEQQLALNLR
jgi:hypothetical protein